jgi:CheY-like chemotaxis protein
MIDYYKKIWLNTLLFWVHLERNDFRIHEGGPMTKILLIDDSISDQKRWKAALEARGLEVEQAFDLISAERFFGRLDEFALIAWDGYIPLRTDGDRDGDSIELIEVARTLYSGPMVAMSSDIGMLSGQVEAGCDHKSNKTELPGHIVTILEKHAAQDFSCCIKKREIPIHFTL